MERNTNSKPLDQFIDESSLKRKTPAHENVVDIKKPCLDKDEKQIEDGEIIEDESSKNKSEPGKIDQINRKRKVALLLAYCGARYHGMQKNPDVETIELKLLEALCKINAIKSEHKEAYLVTNDNQISFQRAARTDKGVSAARQVVSLKMVVEESFLEDVNKELPSDIKVFGHERVTKKFDAKCSCSGRSYEYLIPSYAFAPSKHIMGPSYRISDDQLEVVTDIFKRYIGTHNFHNFTSGKHFTEKSAIRYITNFKPGKPYIEDGYEFISIEIDGQSFMIHQIRKMIGLCIAISRGYCPIETLDKAFKEDKLDIPKAPGLGLLLNNVFFKQYNKKFGQDGMHKPLTFDKEQESVVKFKKEIIWKNIVEQEVKTSSMASWLKTLSNHTYKENGMTNVIPGNEGGQKGAFPPNSIKHKQTKDDKPEDIFVIDKNISKENLKVNEEKVLDSVKEEIS